MFVRSAFIVLFLFIFSYANMNKENKSEYKIVPSGTVFNLKTCKMEGPGIIRSIEKKVLKKAVAPKYEVTGCAKIPFLFGLPLCYSSYTKKTSDPEKAIDRSTYFFYGLLIIAVIAIIGSAVPQASVLTPFGLLVFFISLISLFISDNDNMYYKFEVKQVSKGQSGETLYNLEYKFGKDKNCTLKVRYSFPFEEKDFKEKSVIPVKEFAKDLYTYHIPETVDADFYFDGKFRCFLIRKPGGSINLTDFGNTRNPFPYKKIKNLCEMSFSDIIKRGLILPVKTDTKYELIKVCPEYLKCGK